jgi:P63C domain
MEEITGRAKGGIARAQNLTLEQRREIGRKGALARWGDPTNTTKLPQAICEGSLDLGVVELDSYVLKDRRRVFHKRNMADAIGLKSQGGNVFLRTINSKGLGSLIPDKIKDKMNNPIVFRTPSGAVAHGFEGTDLIEVCDAIWEARKQGKLTTSQHLIGIQAEIIIRSVAKVGIIALIDEATGYIKDKGKEEYREFYKQFVREEARQYEKEFPDQLFDVIYELYHITRKHKNKHPQFFGHFIRKYIYKPLANSNGAVLEMIDEKNPVVYTSGGRKYKIFQFLEEIGTSALRSQIWQVIGIGNATRSKQSFDKAFAKAFPQSGDQPNLFEGLLDD